MVFLFIGAVTSTSILPSRYSCTARSNAWKAASPLSSVGRPKSTFTSSLLQLTTFRRSCCASDALSTTLKFIGESIALRWYVITLGEPYTTGVQNSSMVGSSKVLRMTSYPMPFTSPWVMPTTILSLIS